MHATIENPVPLESSEDHLESRYQILRDLLSNKGHLTRRQSDYAVLLSDRLVDAVQNDDVASPVRYNNDTSSPLYKLRQEQLPPVVRRDSIYASFEYMQRADIFFRRKEAGDEFKAATALAKVMPLTDEEDVKLSLQLATGLAFMRRGEDKSVFKAEVSEVTGLPLQVSEPLFNLVKFDSTNLVI